MPLSDSYCHLTSPLIGTIITRSRRILSWTVFIRSIDLVFNVEWFRRISARLPLIREERNEDLDFSDSDDEAGLDQEKSSEDNLDPDADTSRCQKRKLDDDDDDDFMSDGRAGIVYNSSGACPDIAGSLNSIHHMYRLLTVTTVQA